VKFIVDIFLWKPHFRASSRKNVQMLSFVEHLSKRRDEEYKNKDKIVAAVVEI